MKTEQEITNIVRDNGGSKIGVSRFPSWLNKIKQEGVQIELGKIRTFWVKDEQKVYGEAPSQSWQKVIDEIKDTQKPEMVKQEKVPQQNESTEIADRFVPEVIPEKIGIIPNTLTVPLLEKWKKMTTFERMLMFQNTPQDRIEERNGRGGKLKYVKGNFMIQEANIAFMFRWNSKIEGWNVTPEGVTCYGSVQALIDDNMVFRACVGIDLQEMSKANGKPIFTVPEMMKNAATDMIKKGLSSLGFNSDVYRGEV